MAFPISEAHVEFGFYSGDTGSEEEGFTYTTETVASPPIVSESGPLEGPEGKEQILNVNFSKAIVIDQASVTLTLTLTLTSRRQS